MSSTRLTRVTGPPASNQYYRRQQEPVTCSYVLEIVQFVLLPICFMLALGVLIPAAVALSLIGQVEEYSERSPFVVESPNYRFRGGETELNFETFNAGGSRGAAGWSLFASIIAIISQIAIYASCSLTIAEHYYATCSINITVIWCFINAILLFVGGIVSVIYFAETDKLWRDQCSSYISRDPPIEECEDLYSVTGCQIAGGVIAFLSSLLYIAFSCIIKCIDYQKNKEGSLAVRSGHSLSSSVSSRGQTNTPLQPRMQPATVPLSNIQPPELPSVQPSAPILVEPSAPPLIQPSAPPPGMQTNEPSNLSTNDLPSNSKFKSMAPPTYESTLTDPPLSTDPPPYETALTNTS